MKFFPQKKENYREGSGEALMAGIFMSVRRIKCIRRGCIRAPFPAAGLGGPPAGPSSTDNRIDPRVARPRHGVARHGGPRSGRAGVSRIYKIDSNFDTRVTVFT